MNIEDFVTYKQAIKLKELEFNEECNHYYNDEKVLVESLADYNNEDSYNSPATAYDDFNHGYSDEVLCSAPTLWQVQGWLRKKNIDIEIPMEPHPDHIRTYSLYAVSTNEDNPFGISGEGYNSYEEALSVGITESLKMLENNGRSL